MQVKKVIKQYGWTQEKLAEKIGTTQSSLSTCLNRGSMSQRMLHKIAEAIGCDYNEFFADEPERSSSSDEYPLYPEGTIDLGYVTLNGQTYRQLFIPAMI